MKRFSALTPPSSCAYVALPREQGAGVRRRSGKFALHISNAGMANVGSSGRPHGISEQQCASSSLSGLFFYAATCARGFA